MREGISVAKAPIVIVGAGLAGLSAAHYLQKFGREVLVLEASDRPGGRVATDNVNGFLCDRGFQLINTKYPELRALSVVDQMEWVIAPRSVDISLLDRTISLGDPRQGIGGALDNATGSWREKLNFVKYLAQTPQEQSSVGYQMRLAGLGSLYERVLKPFLTGVFLANPEVIDAGIGRKLIQHFITGSPAIPVAGAGALPRKLAEGIKNISYNVTVNSISQNTLSTSMGDIEASAVIVATDATTTAQLVGLDWIPQFNGCITWYHSCLTPPSDSKNLRLDGSNRGPVINSLVMSNLVSQTAPAGQCLISSTTLLGASETDVRTHLAQLWGVSTHEWQLVAKYEIRNALPHFAPGYPSVKQKISDTLFIAGDYCTEPSQNGALLAGRLAAQELVLN